MEIFEVSATNDLATVAAKFPPGTPVCVRQVTRMRAGDFESEVVGTVEAWEDLPTGSWYAHGKDSKLWLWRLKLRKSDGEISVIVVDDQTYIAKLEAASN